MWLVIGLALTGLGLVVLRDSPRLRRLRSPRRHPLADHLLAAGLEPSFDHTGPDGRWVMHFDGQLLPGVSAGARLDPTDLVLTAELTIADGRADMPELVRRDADPGGAEGPAAAVLFARAARREALTDYLDRRLAGVDRRVRIARGSLVLETTLSSLSPSSDVGRALEHLTRTARAVEPGLAAPLTEQLGEAATDRELPASLRESARRHLVVEHPFSDEALELARPLIGHRDPIVALSAAVLVDDAERIVEALHRAPADWMPLAHEQSRLNTLLDRVRAKVDPITAAGAVADIGSRRLRTAWLAALLRGGNEAPARAALTADPSPALRAEIAAALAERIARWRGGLDPELEALLVEMLVRPAPEGHAAARTLAAHGGSAALPPLARWRASLDPAVSGTPLHTLVEVVDAGLDRIRAGLDPALAGQLSVSTGDGGALSMARGGGLSTLDGGR